MKRSITRWTMALATAGVLSLPVSSFARTTQDPQPQPQPQQQQPPAQPQQQPQPTPAPQQQPTPTPQPSATAAQPQAEQAVTPQDHLKKAQEAANDISASSLPAKNKTALDEMKRHLTNLDKVGSSSATPSPAETAKKGSDDSKAMNWGTEVAAIDKIIGEMVGSESSTPTTPATPTPTGTSGKSSAIDDATRAKLMEVRAHITAYAAGMAGASTPKTEAATPKAEAAAPKAETAAPKAEAAATPATPAARPEPSTQGSTPSPAAQNPPAQSPSPSPAQPDPNAAPPAAQQPTPAAQAPAAQAQPQVDTDTAHKYLVAARETLAQLTQLPAAAQLAGEARNQVSQLITNFNELITTQSNWKATYDKVNANLTALIGPDNSAAEANAGAAAAPNAPATATPGAVGTAGSTTVELDPAIRAKLVELRKSLNEFRKAAGGQ